MKVLLNICQRNIVLWALIGLLLASSVNWKACLIQRGKYLLGIFYNGYFQNADDGVVYRDYLKTHGITHEFIAEHI